MNDRYAQTVGFVAAGVGLAAAFLAWPADAALASRAAAVAAGLALAAFAARRYGVDAAELDYAAAAAGGALALVAAVGVVAVDGALPPGPVVALFAGLGAVGLAVAAVTDLDADAVRDRERSFVVALVVSVVALVFGSLVGTVAVGFVPDDPLARVPTSTIASSVGFAFAGLAFLGWYGGDLDVRSPSRHDAVVAAAGTVAILALHYGMVGVVLAFDLPQTSHSLVETARESPGILPPLVLLSYLAIAPAEELLARNGVQKYLYGAYSRYGAVVVGCLVFTAVHVLAYTGTGATPGAVLVTLSRLFVVSLVLGATYERTDDLFAPVVVHGTYDAVQFALAYATFA